MGIEKKKAAATAAPKKAKETDIFSDENRLARDLAEGWFKFEEVGDKVGGTIRDIFEMPERDGMQAQRCFTVEQSDGVLVNVGLKRTNYILSRTDMLQVGDMLGVKFEKEIPAKSKGHHPAKSMVIFSKLNGARGNATAATVKVSAPTADAGEDAGEESADGEEF